MLHNCTKLFAKSHHSGAQKFRSKLTEYVKRAALLLLCMAYFLTVLTPLCASAKESSKTVRVGWYKSPFNTMDDAGRKSGYAYEYQQKIAAYTGWNYEYVEGTWSDLLQMLIDGDLDLMSDVSYTPERTEQMLFSNLSMGAEEYYLFALPEHTEIRQDDPRTLNGKRIGVNKGSVQENCFREWAALHSVEAELVELTTSEVEALQMMQDGELDAYITLDAYGDLDTVVPVFKVGSSDFFFAVNRERMDLLEELNAAMNRIQDENRYFNQQLSQKYISTSGANLFLSASELRWLSDHGPIRVGYQDSFLAFCAAEKSTGELTGAMKDYLQHASGCFKNAQLTFEPVAYSTSAAAMEALREGEVDCACSPPISAPPTERPWGL